MTKRNNLVLEKITSGVDSWLRVIARGYEEAPRFRATHEAHTVLRDFGGSDRAFVPFHLDKVGSSLQFNHAIDLFDNAFTRFTHKMKGLLNQYSVCLKKSIQSRFELLAALMGRQ